MGTVREMGCAAVLAALTFGCIMGASMLKLADVGNAVGGASDLAQWVQIALLFAFAWLNPHVKVPVFRMVALGCVALTGMLAAEYAFLVAAPQASVFDGILTPRALFALLQGVVEFAFMLVCAQLFSRLPPKHSSAAVSLGLVVNMAVLCLQPALSTPQITVARVVLLLAGAFFACVATACLRGEPDARPWGKGPGDGDARAPRPTGVACRGADRTPAFVLFVACAAVFAFLYGFLGRSTLHYEVAVGTRNLAGQLVLLGLALALCAYAWARGITMRGDAVVYALAPLFVAAYAVVAVSRWGLFIAEVIAGAGYMLLRLLLWVTAARFAHANPSRLGFYTALVALGTTFGAQLGFEAAQLLVTNGIEVPPLWAALSAALLCAACCLAMAPGYRRQSDDLDMSWMLGCPVRIGEDRLEEGAVGGSEAQAAEGASSSPTALSVVPGPWESFGAFVGCYGLSQRERQILEEALHGYTMAVIADKLGLSANTVRTYMRRIYTKAGVDNKQQLIELMEHFGR